MFSSCMSTTVKWRYLYTSMIMKYIINICSCLGTSGERVPLGSARGGLDLDSDVWSLQVYR